LQIIDVERLAIHGGSLRITAELQPPASKSPTSQPSSRVRDLLQSERQWGVDKLAAYRGFADRVLALKGQLTELLARLRAQGKRIAVYGASAKGSTLLNYLGIDNTTLDFLVDRSSVKQGRFTPGTHFRIDAPRRLLDDMPHYCLLLAWNFADEIVAQQQEYVRRGGKFILPLPVPQIVSRP